MIKNVGIALVLGGSMAIGGAAALPAHAALGGDLAEDLDAILSDDRLQGATVGVIVRDAKTGATLYDRTGGGSVVPASNNKLQTSAAAFDILGPGYRFRTTVSVKGGNLYLTGTGDTTMRAAEYDRLAAAVAAKGITRVRGDLIADDTWFDDRRTPADWDPTDLQYAYAAQTSALTVSPNDDFDAGSVQIDVAPGSREGDPVRVGLTPDTDVVKIDNRAVTGAPGSQSTLAINRSNGSNTIVVTGSYPVDGQPTNALRSVEEPTLYAADVFRKALARHGVRVAGATERGRTPADARVVAARTSMPLSRLATPFLKLSNNVMAETLVKAIGRKTRGRGTWEAGLPAVVADLRRLGVDTSQVTMTDGSGLSRGNHTTPEQLGTLLRNVRRRPWFPAWYAALPIAGQPDPMVGGTLADRMQGTAAAGNVHAKTGTLTGVTALSGYVRDPDGRTLIFSSVFNGYSGGAPKDIEDAIAVRLATGDDEETRTTLRRGPVNGGHLEPTWLNGRLP
ncbi:MAG TPA: D-alanyl-D-alanine carboxypeptidase/D-alanyl-D-alanine-endopeptidase [Spirillospora sp.]